MPDYNRRENVTCKWTLDDLAKWLSEAHEELKRDNDEAERKENENSKG
jgi:hypothetical protein